MKKETLKQAGYKYIGYSRERGAHVLRNVWNTFEIWAANKGHASYGLIWRNTELEFCASLPDKDGNAFIHAQACKRAEPWRASHIFKELAPDYSPKLDPWGYAMALAFDIGAACYERGLWEGVRALGCSPGAGGSEFTDPYVRRRLMRMGEKRLVRLALFADRVIRMLERAGRSY